MEEIVFFTQWNNRPVTKPQVFTLPTCTIPDQSMTIQEIIAKYTRTGLVPQSFVHKDQGGNVAFEPDFDPLDEFTETMAGSERVAGPAGSAENDLSSGGAGETGGSQSAANAGKEGVSEL